MSATKKRQLFPSVPRQRGVATQLADDIRPVRIEDLRILDEPLEEFFERTMPEA